jgi:uncharacterized protein (TIGR03437 family)
LYFETSVAMASAWENQWAFDGNGDGTLFYPGTPNRIGGTNHIPIESIRLKLIREGMEDYEYLRLLCYLGDCEWAKSTARTLFPAPSRVTTTAPEAVYAARAAIADRIEAKLAAVPGPVINAGGVVNAASYTAPLSPGSIGSIFGSNFSGDTLSSNAAALPTSMLGVTVRLNGLLAPLFFASPGQINFQVPWELAGAATASVVVSAAGGAVSQSSTVAMAGYAPAIFTLGPPAAGQGTILTSTFEVAASAESVPGFISRPARVGELVSIVCIGLGQVNNPPATRAPAWAAPLSVAANTPTVMIGGFPATDVWAGLAPGSIGLYQVNARVPLQTPAGIAVPVVVSAGGVNSNSVTMAVSRE